MLFIISLVSCDSRQRMTHLDAGSRLKGGVLLREREEERLRERESDETTHSVVRACTNGEGTIRRQDQPATVVTFPCTERLF